MTFTIGTKKEGIFLVDKNHLKRVIT